MTDQKHPAQSDQWNRFDGDPVAQPAAAQSSPDDVKQMPTYVMLSRLTERGRDRVKSHPERILEVNHEVEQRGCVVVAQYALMGIYDFVTIIRAPDNGAMHRLAIDLGARGTIETHTLPAIPTDEFIAVMNLENDAAD